MSKVVKSCQATMTTFNPKLQLPPNRHVGFQNQLITIGRVIKGRIPTFGKVVEGK